MDRNGMIVAIAAMVFSLCLPASCLFDGWHKREIAAQMVRDGSDPMGAMCAVNVESTAKCLVYLGGK